MLKVLKTEERTDRNGKKYKYILLHSPEHKFPVMRNGKVRNVVSMERTCGYVAYKVNYAESQSSDPHYDLEEGDVIPGRIVRESVDPYMVGDKVMTFCKVPVFCEEYDPIEFEIAKENALKRAGKKQTIRMNIYGDLFKPVDIVENKVPDGCLVVNIIND